VLLIESSLFRVNVLKEVILLLVSKSELQYEVRSAETQSGVIVLASKERESAVVVG